MANVDTDHRAGSAPTSRLLAGGEEGGTSPSGLSIFSLCCVRRLSQALWVLLWWKRCYGDLLTNLIHL